VFLSAKGQDEEIQSGMSVGAAAYILKPFSPTELTKRVTEILDGAGAANTAGAASAPTASTPAAPPAPSTNGTGTS
jgi:DNA-binding response OmpR family regulator